MDVVVTRDGISSPPYTATSQTHAPALLQWGGGQYPYALISRGADYIGNPAIVPNTVPAHAGDTLTLWATGLTSSPAVPAGQQPVTFPTTTTPIVATVAGLNAKVLGAVLRFAGLYQINIQLPNALPAGDLVVRITQVTDQSPDGVLIHIE